MKIFRNIFSDNKNAKAVAFFLFACFCFGAMNSLIKLLGHSLNPYVISAYRAFFCILITLPFIAWQIQNGSFMNLSLKFRKVNLFKGVNDFLSTPLWVVAVTNMNISEVVSITFLTPVITALLAVLIFKEKMSRQRWLIMLIGFCGAYIVVNPNSENFNEYSLVALLMCFLWSGTNLLTKNLSGKQHPLTIVFYSNLLVFLISLPFIFNLEYSLNTEKVGQLFILATIAVTGNYSLAKAFSLSSVTNLLPFDYTRLIFSAIVAYVLFGQTMSFNAALGGAIILASSLYLIRKNQKKSEA